MTRQSLRTRQRKLVCVWAALSLVAIYIQGRHVELDRNVTSRLMFHAIPMAVSVLYHGRVHDYTAFSSVAFPFQSPLPDVDTKIAAAISSTPPANDPTYYWAADDRGMGDYVIAAFTLFGPRSSSLYFFYFVVLGASVALFLADLGWHPVASAILLFVLGALYTCTSVIPLGNLTLPIFEAGSLYEPRIIELLSLVATVHLALTPFFDQRWTPARGAIVAAQCAIFVACYHARSSVGWQVAFVLMVNVGAWIPRRLQRRERPTARSRSAILGAAWPTICVVVGLSLLTMYHHVAYNPRYYHDIGARTVWHNALMGLSFNQHLRDKYGLTVDDRAVIRVVLTHLRANNDWRLTPEWTESALLRSFGGHATFNGFTYERAASDLYWHIWRTDTRDMLHLYLVDKPREIVRVLVNARRPDPDVPASLPNLPGLGFNPFGPVAVAIVLPGLLFLGASGSQFAAIIGAMLLLFACSAVPGWFFYPVVHTMMGAFATVALTAYLTLAQVVTIAKQPISSLIPDPLRRVRIPFLVLSDRQRSEWVRMLGLAVLTLLIAGYFAPRGFRSGFTDITHDGYQLRQVLDLDRGGTIFKDTFDQDGPLSGYLNVMAYRTFGRNLLAVKYSIGLWYAATAVLLYLLARHLMAPGLSVVSVLAWLALAPFYGHGVMISPHAYVLFSQALATLALVGFAEHDRLRWVAIAGVCCGLCWALKTSMGVLFAVGVSAYFAVRLLDGRLRVSRTMTALATFLGAAVSVVASALAFLAFRGALHDWYLQTVVFPKAVYLDRIGAGVGMFASLATFTRHFLSVSFGTTDVPVAVYWHLIRVVVVLGAIVLWRRRRGSELLLISACLTPALWLGAYPSADYIHQWWATSLSIAPFVYCVHSAIDLAIRRVAPAREGRLEPMVTVAALALVLWPGLTERSQSAWERAATLTETFEAPESIRGIRTDKATLTAFQALYGAIRNYKQHHPSARIISRDQRNCFANCVPESLLWLSFADGNTTGHPIYWPSPVLTKRIYPDYDSRFHSDLERTGPLVVDSWIGPFRPDNTLAGYSLLVGVRTETGYWYLFAPDHPSASEHGEVQVRLEPQPAVRIPNAGTQTTNAVRDDVQLGARVPDTVPLRVYTWPADVDVPAPPSAVDAVNVQTAWRAKMVVVDRGRWVAHGSAEAPFSYLMYFKERTVPSGGYFFATGRLYEGGISVGLQTDQHWAGSVNIMTPGPFAIVLSPNPGRYSLVLANNLTTTPRDLFRRHGVAALWPILNSVSLPNSWEIDRAGWASSRR